MGNDACIAFGFNLGYRSDLPERWQEQGDPEDGFEPPAIMRAKLEFLARGFPGLRMTDEQTRRYEMVEKQILWSFPIDILAHGPSYQKAMYFLAIRGLTIRTENGSPAEFDPKDLTVNGFQIRQLKEFCMEHGIKWQWPKWHILLDQEGA